MRQRIYARLFIQRGTFIYDDDGNLGSRLESLLSEPAPDLEDQISMMVAEALAPMRDVIIQDISVTVEGTSNDPADMRRPHVHLDIAIDPSVYEAVEFTDQPFDAQTSVSFDF